MNTSETGYEKNLSIYEQMLDELNAPTANYNPPLARLSIENLETRVEPTKAALKVVNSCQSDYIFAVNNRQNAYDDMEQRITQVNTSLPLFEPDARTMADFKSVYSKVKGYSAISQQGYEHLKENFEAYLALLKKVSNYSTTDEKLSLEALDSLDTQLGDYNKAVSEADATLSSARDARNQLMYDEETGIVPLCKSVKQYYKSAEGVNGVMFKRFVALMKPLRVIKS